MSADSHHLFLSYVRADNRTGRISEVSSRLTAVYRADIGSDLVIFFDADSLGGGDRWLDYILRQLKQSKILLVCLSPTYLESEFCRHEFAEHLRGETVRGLSGSGVLPIWAFDIPTWQDRAYDDAAPEGFVSSASAITSISARRPLPPSPLPPRPPPPGA